MSKFTLDFTTVKVLHNRLSLKRSLELDVSGNG